MLEMGVCMVNQKNCHNVQFSLQYKIEQFGDILENI